MENDVLQILPEPKLPKEAARPTFKSDTLFDILANPDETSYFSWVSEIGTKYEKAACLTEWIGVTPYQIFANIAYKNSHIKQKNNVKFGKIEEGKKCVKTKEERESEEDVKLMDNQDTAACSACQLDLYYEGNNIESITNTGDYLDNLPICSLQIEGFKKSYEKTIDFQHYAFGEC